MFERVNLKAELIKIRESDDKAEAEHILDRFKHLFRADWECDARIQQALDSDATLIPIQTSVVPDAGQIYTLDEIKTLCIHYRLRFLPTRYFKADFPRETMRAIKNVERDLDTKIESFCILAPASLFNLEDANADPLLFAPLEDGTFYLVHQWGNDLAWYRKLLALPFRNITNLVLSILCLSGILAWITPGSLISDSANFFSFARLLMFIWFALTSSALVSYIWFLTNQKFSCDAWSSRTFN